MDEDKGSTLSLVEDNQKLVELTLAALGQGFLVTRGEETRGHLYHLAAYRSQTVGSPDAALLDLNEQSYSASELEP